MSIPEQLDEVVKHCIAHTKDWNDFESIIKYSVASGAEFGIQTTLATIKRSVADATPESTPANAQTCGKPDNEAQA